MASELRLGGRKMLGLLGAFVMVVFFQVPLRGAIRVSLRVKGFRWVFGGV